MSEFHSVDIPIDDAKALVGALEELGYDKVELFEEVKEVNVRGKKVKANVMAKGRWGNIAFERREGKFKIHKDSMDKIKIEELVQLHHKHKIKNAILKKSSKYKVTKEEVDQHGNIRIKVKVRA